MIDKLLVATAPVEKALQIKLARDVDGATFWGALDEALVPRLKASGAGADGDAALAEFGNVFKNRSLQKGCVITLTWVQPSTLKVTICSSVFLLTFVIFRAVFILKNYM